MNINKVLLVDDEDDIRMVAQISLADVGGLETAVAASGQEGIDRARADRPDIIILDMMMPVMDGMETLRRLREDAATRDIPVIFMTARVQRHEVEAYLDAGAAAVIDKPFDPMSLHEQVREIAAGISAG